MDKQLVKQASYIVAGGLRRGLVKKAGDIVPQVFNSIMQDVSDGAPIQRATPALMGAKNNAQALRQLSGVFPPDFLANVLQRNGGNLPNLLSQKHLNAFTSAKPGLNLLKQYPGLAEDKVQAMIHNNVAINNQLEKMKRNQPMTVDEAHKLLSRRNFEAEQVPLSPTEQYVADTWQRERGKLNEMQKPDTRGWLQRTFMPWTNPRRGYDKQLETVKGLEGAMAEIAANQRRAAGADKAQANFDAMRDYQRRMDRLTEVQQASDAEVQAVLQKLGIRLSPRAISKLMQRVYRAGAMGKADKTPDHLLSDLLGYWYQK